MTLLFLGGIQPLCGQGVTRFETTTEAIAFDEVSSAESGTVAYFVDILDKLGIYTAAFSFQQLPTKPSTDAVVFFSGETGWSGEIIDEVDWESGTELFVGALTYNTASTGSFVSETCRNVRLA